MAASRKRHVIEESDTATDGESSEETANPSTGNLATPLMSVSQCHAPLSIIASPPMTPLLLPPEMSFEELLQLQNKVGKKAFQHGRQPRPPQEKARPPPAKKGAPPTNTGPEEMSSKKRAPFLRKVVPVKKMMRRDPRFDDLSGEFSADAFDKTYRFLGDMKRREREAVEKQLKKTKQPEMKEKLETLLRRMDQQEAAAQKKRELRDSQLQHKREQRERARQGHKPFYLKKGEEKKLRLMESYGELKRRGKLEQFLSKKRKRNAHKDRRRLPNQ
ncbi:ribosomal RNA processing protein 36 homolog [Gastrophryne carolinensis]